MIKKKAAIIGQLLSRTATATLSVVTSAASLSKYGYLNSTLNMWLQNINLDNVPQAASLADIKVTQDVYGIPSGEVNINKVEGDIASILKTIKCNWLSLSKIHLNDNSNKSLVVAMTTGISHLVLGRYGSVEVDMDTLAIYNGLGKCKSVGCWGQTRKKYGGQIRQWAESLGWRVRYENIQEIVICSQEQNLLWDSNRC